METMTKFTAATCALALSATGALAGGVDRSNQAIDVLFEEGNAVQLSFGWADPTVSATASAVTGDLANPYVNFSVGIKKEINDKLDVAVILDQPFGADASYKGAMTGAMSADLSTLAVTAVGRYHFNENVSVHGGLRAQKASAYVTVPPVAGYVLDVDSGGFDIGYLVGAAYERKDIAMRVALTYNSSITHDMDGSVAFEQETPQSVNLDFQTGIAPGTLLFGSVRWVDWTEFSVEPPDFAANPLTSYDHDSISYEIGLGKQLTDKFSGAVTLGYEKRYGDVSSNLGPTDGYWSIGVGGSYKIDESTKLSAGVRYVALGDALGGTLTAGTPFTDNSAIGAGISLTKSF